MSIIDELFTFNKLPQWVSSRLALAVNDIKKPKDFFIQRLQEDRYTRENNNGTAFFLTDDELVQVYFNLENIRIEKFKLIHLLKVDKLIENLDSDILRDEDIHYKSVSLEFPNNKTITLTQPDIANIENSNSYIKIISKL